MKLKLWDLNENFSINTNVVYNLPVILLYAQQGALVLKGIEENRTVGFGAHKLEFSTKLTGVLVDEEHQVSLSELSVIDDLGNNLKSIDRYSRPINQFTMYPSVVFAVEPPSRKAKQVSVKGVAEYFTISEALKSKQIYSNLSERYHVNLLQEISEELKFVLIDLVGLNELKKNNESAYTKKVKEIHRNGGVGSSFEAALNYVNNAIIEINFWKKDPEKLLHFYKVDPNDKIVKIKAFEDGETLFSGTYASATTFQYNLSKELTAGIELQIIVKTKEAIVKIPFEFNDITLP